MCCSPWESQRAAEGRGLAPPLALGHRSLVQGCSSSVLPLELKTDSKM